MNIIEGEEEKNRKREKNLEKKNGDHDNKTD